MYIEYIHEREIYFLMGEVIYGRTQINRDNVNRFISEDFQRIWRIASNSGNDLQIDEYFRSFLIQPEIA